MKKYVYFVSYVIDNNSFYNSEITLYKEINSMGAIRNIQHTLCCTMFKTAVVLNFQLLRIEEAEETEEIDE